MNLDLLGHWRGGAIKDAGDEAIRLHGADALNNINIGLLESGYGANQENVANYIKTQQQKALNADPTIQAAAISAGLKPYEQSGGFANYGETQAGLLTRIQSAQEAKTENTRQQRLNETIAAEGRAQANAMEVLAAQNENSNNQFRTQLQTQENRLNYQDKQNRLDRALERDLSRNSSDMNLAIAQMNADLADKRMAYDRETRRMDKRQQAIATLMGGLGQLGGAFAL